jgi:hypothetical protein
MALDFPVAQYNNSYSIFAADDFNITFGTWAMRNFLVYGKYISTLSDFNSKASKIELKIYNSTAVSNSSSPYSEIYSAVNPILNANYLEFNISLNLGPGLYWFAVIPQMNFSYTGNLR